MTTPIEHERAPGRSMWSSVSSAAANGLGVVAGWIGRIVCGFKGMAPLVFAIGCQTSCQSASDLPAPAPAPIEEGANVSVAEEPIVLPDAGPRQLGKFNITFYYVIGEEEVVPRAKKPAAANDNQLVAGADGSGGSGAGSSGADAGSGMDLAAAAPLEKYTLYGSTKDCEPIAEVTRAFALELNMQGTGKLRDGRVVNVWGPCNCATSPCWRVTQQQWGTAGTGRPLQPFRTVAVDPKLIKLGSLLHIPLLEGRTMPGRAPWGGFVHDGCVVADDTGGAIRDHQIDLFVGRKGWFLGMSGSPGSHSWARHVPVYDGSKICERRGRRVGRKSGSI